MSGAPGEAGVLENGKVPSGRRTIVVKKTLFGAVVAVIGFLGLKLMLGK